MERPTNPMNRWAILALAGLLLVLGGFSFVRRVSVAKPALGVEWVQSSSGPVALGVASGSPAARGGLLPGDVLLEVNQLRIENALDAAEMAWEAAPGESLVVRVLRGNGSVTLEVRPAWQSQSEIYLYLAVVGLAFWVSGLFIATRWPGIRGGWVYTLLALCLFSQLVFSQSGQADVLDWIVHWSDLLAGALAPALLLHLALVLARRNHRRRLVLSVGYGVSLLLTAVTVWLSPAGRGGAYLFADPLRAVEARERLEPLVLAVALVFAVALLVKSFVKSASVLHRSQMRWLLWGLGLGLGPSVMFYAVPFALGAPELPNWAIFLTVAPMLFVPAAFTAALARYRLYDLDQLLVRGFTEVSAIFCTFAVYSAVAFLLREIVAEVIPFSRSATRYIGFAVAAVSYPQLRTWVRAGIERAFYRKRYSYRATLLDWARDLNEDTDLDSLLERLRKRVRATLSVPDAEVFLLTGPRRFEILGNTAPGAVLELSPSEFERLHGASYIACEPGSLPQLPWVEYLFSMKVKDRLRAVLAISGRRQLEEPLSTEDRALLGTLSAQAATAIEAARLVQEVRQRAEEVERLHARQAQILESSAVGLLLINDEWRILAWNRALEEIYGRSRDATIGRQLSDVFPLHVVRRIEREAKDRDRGDEARIFRLDLVNAVGQRVVVNLSISPVEGNHAAGRVVTFDDVTERAKLEEQLSRQERLASLGLLAAGVAHEINTPLTGISSYAQLLMDEGRTSEPQRSLLKKIETQTNRASNITKSLLNLARPERSEFEPIELNGTVREILNLFEPQVRGRPIQLRTYLYEQPLMLHGHRGKLQQVLLNLLINARDAVAEAGKGTIELTTTLDGDRVALEVRDDGIGIAEEDLSRVFDPFFTTKTRGQGTGLGLSITYGIVKEHDGEITVDRVKDVRKPQGGGTLFRVEFPALGASQAAARS